MPLLIRFDEGVGIDHHGSGLFKLTLILTVLSTALIFIRMQQRLSHTQKFGNDDAAILSSMVFNILLCVTTLVGVNYGYGMHESELGDHHRYVARLTFFLEQILYKGTLNFTKLSMLLMYLRIFTGKRAREAIWMLIWTISFYALISIAVTVIQCGPFEKIFDNSVLGTCIDMTSFWYANAIFSLVTDLIIVALPVPAVYEMQIKKMYKFGLFILFSLGLFVCGITLIRMIPLETTSKDPDVTFGTYTSTYWSIVEVNTAILCSCAPTWKFLLGKFFPCVFPDDDTSNNSRGGRTHHAPFGTYAVSHGHYGVSHVSQASSQVPLTAPPRARRGGRNALRSVPYDQTVSAGGPSFGRLQNRDIEMHALESTSGPSSIEDTMAAIEEVRREEKEESR